MLATPCRCQHTCLIVWWYRVSVGRYMPLNVSLSCEIVEKMCFAPPRFVGAGDRPTPDFGHTFSNRTYFRDAAVLVEFRSANSEGSGRMKKIDWIAVKRESTDKYVGRPNYDKTSLLTSIPFVNQRHEKYTRMWPTVNVVSRQTYSTKSKVYYNHDLQGGPKTSLFLRSLQLLYVDIENVSYIKLLIWSKRMCRTWHLNIICAISVWPHYTKITINSDYDVQLKVIVISV